MSDKQIPRPLDRTVDNAEIAKFAAMADAWWDPDGKFRPLHKFNPVRLEFVRDRIAAHFERDATAEKPLAGLNLVDVGCGGGLLTEPMARLGADVTGIDATERNAEVARVHAERMGLPIDYRFATAADLAQEERRFDVVLNMEVIEHVADRAAFLADCAALVRPGGLMFLATLNRTAKAYLLAIVGAEYIMRWLPRGTHDWQRFVRPSEMAAWLRDAGMTLTELSGVTYNPINDRWSLAPQDLDVNYIAVAIKPGSD
ncbi:MAG: bifunctional 2-polyprenyl-6-hydroxyphenol methylase/3-demethylubiquinol 3-O-methyltransferase UbiG [Alphaproteobacteria bacterium]|nr:bifunctional 2-polyprenyl-6-hydroxyphenol methylase/3-demethylubiquinol 3-O-methyltransferase UbiG [Alphaproteobacteria bacterium]